MINQAINGGIRCSTSVEAADASETGKTFVKGPSAVDVPSGKLFLAIEIIDLPIENGDL